jgi:3-polyprenyl-4-hydroxybenzoate decarboxylase
VKNAYYGIAGEIAHVIWSARHGLLTPSVIVVEDDVDPCNLQQVFHALMTKCHPGRGINKIDHATAWPLIPWLSEYEREHRIGARVYYDCTWPVDWPKQERPVRQSFAECYPQKVQELALEKWRRALTPGGSNAAKTPDRAPARGRAGAGARRGVPVATGTDRGHHRRGRDQ